MRWTASAIGFASAFGLAWGTLANEPAPPSPTKYLTRWASLSKTVREADLDQYTDRYGDEYPDSVLKYMAAFFGPVEQAGLETAFRWSVIEEREGEVRLRATPRSHDALATSPLASQASSASARVMPPLASPEQAGAMLAFDVVLDTEFHSPRLVTWLGAGPDLPREAVSKLYPMDEVDSPRMFRGGFLSRSEGDGVEQASASMLNAELDAAATPAVLEVLSRWEQATMALKSVEINFKRFDRDSVFEVETRGVGKFIYVAPNKGLYTLKGAPVVERAEGPSTATGGKMAVAAAKPQLYWWSGENVTIVDEREKTYDTLPIPKRMSENIQTVGSWDVIWQVLAGPQKALPAVVDLRAEKMLNRFEWSVEENSDTQIHLEGVPRTSQDRRHIKQLSVMLDPKTYRTTATRLVDPSGSRETIHRFEYVKVNDASLDDQTAWKPELAALSPLGPPPLAPAVEELPGAPPPQ
ncbi:hypothetical protein Pan44_11560 [Caulifigura coniformis]|uniref:DUF3857 domain-containing protein n=1 Tax=Caulifigura coniformis TaxID=2527983 RepID=A0A517SAI6_9PLAN|nr:hypothetical protein [Caulifigura coniformis]QDT53141.1 hypothetical protein Pan44_11560 [Caulifigura coniformis]